MKNDMAKAVHHLAVGRQYLEGIVPDLDFSIKHIMRGYIQRIKWVEADAYSRMDAASRENYNSSLIKGDTLFFDALSEKLLKLHEPEKLFIETIVDGLIRGEKIEML